MDRSGFVDWTFYNITSGAYLPGRGGGTVSQHGYCANISWSDVQPDELVFYSADVHVGIVGGKDTAGNLLIVHCSGDYEWRSHYRLGRIHRCGKIRLLYGLKCIS